MSGVLEKIKHMAGLADLEEYGDYDEYEEYEEVEEETHEDDFMNTTRKKDNNKIVNIHTANNMKLVIHEPLNYEDAPKIVDDLKSRKTVVVNLEQLEPLIKRKIFDFINGGLYSLEGNIQKVTTDIFILAPKNVEIDGDIRDNIKNKNIFNW